MKLKALDTITQAEAGYGPVRAASRRESHKSITRENKHEGASLVSFQLSAGFRKPERIEESRSEQMKRPSEVMAREQSESREKQAGSTNLSAECSKPSESSESNEPSKVIKSQEPTEQTKQTNSSDSAEQVKASELREVSESRGLRRADELRESSELSESRKSRGSSRLCESSERSLGIKRLEQSQQIK